LQKITLNQISPHVVWTAPEEATDRPILGGVIGRNSTLMIEGGASAAHAGGFLGALSIAGLPLPKFLVLTHWHWDHVFGAACLDLPTFAHSATSQKIREMAQLNWGDEALDRRVAAGEEIAFCQTHMKIELTNEVRKSLKLRVPEISFNEQVQIDLGGVTCQVIHVGGDHSSDSSIIYIPEDRIAFIGDCLYEDLYAAPPRYSTIKLFPLFDRLIELNADYYLDAHNPEPISLAGMVHKAKLYKTIGGQVEKSTAKRQDILSELQKELGENQLNDTLDVVDAFIAGLQDKKSFQNQ
jgi:glyoxylase-like metal-dependent hydrolase (beta-lactamase superfamily II)